MKQIKDIKNKISWEEYYNPDFNWSDFNFYRNNQLSEDFIIEFKDKVWWRYITSTQKLSEQFIRKYNYRMDWKDIS